MQRQLPSDHVGRSRLLKLAELLEANSRNKSGICFDYSDWGFIQDSDNPRSCGTTACAMGLAAASGAFRRAGLTARAGEFGEIIFIFKGHKVGGHTAAVRTFRISDDEASDLFMDADLGDTCQGAVAERAAAKLIREFVAGKT